MPQATMPEDRRLILLSPDDNVCVACVDIAAGETVVIDARALHVETAIPLGHKVARRDIAAGANVIKYGAPVGVATQAIRRGEHVHVHNVKSGYLPTYTLEEHNSFLGRAR